MQITFKGVIQKAFPKTTGVSKRTGSTWTKQEFLISEEGERFNQSLVFQVFGEERLAQLSLNEGDRVTAYLDFSTRQWQDRMFTQIGCYKVVRDGEEVPAQQQGQAQDQVQQPAQQQATPTAQPAAPAAPQPAAPEPDPLGGGTASDEDGPF